MQRGYSLASVMHGGHSVLQGCRHVDLYINVCLPMVQVVIALEETYNLA